jgi:DNA-directed RNA polymerase specialized sigma24 family protein
MVETYLNVCLSDETLISYIKFYSRKLSSWYSQYSDSEDVEQDFWEAIVRASKKYDGSKPIITHARSVVFSKYGHMTDKGKSGKIKADKETFRSDNIEDTFSSDDVEYRLVDARYTLDQIQSHLKNEGNKLIRYRRINEYIRYAREGFLDKEIAEKLGVEYSTLRKTKSAIFEAINVTFCE